MTDESAKRAGDLAEQLEKLHGDIQKLLAELAATRVGRSSSNLRTAGIESEVAALRGQATHLAQEVRKLGTPGKS